MFSIFRRLLPQPIKNSGSELRDHLANERTFLSWTRAGIGFAAMGLALGRLEVIDRMLSSTLDRHDFPSDILRGPKAGSAAAASSETSLAGENGPGFSSSYDSSDASSSRWTRYVPEITAPRLCQFISMWSFGYGLMRYFSGRNYLARGQFVPSFWGPVLMTLGSVAVFGAISTHMDKEHMEKEKDLMKRAGLAIGRVAGKGRE